MANTILDPGLLDHFRDVYKHQSKEELTWRSENKGTLCPEALQALEEVMGGKEVDVHLPNIREKESQQKSQGPDARLEVPTWLLNLRWQVTILGATFFMPNRRKDADLFDWVITYALNTAVAAVVAGVALLFFTTSQAGKFWRNQRIAVLVVMAALIWSDYMVNPYRY